MVEGTSLFDCEPLWLKVISLDVPWASCHSSMLFDSVVNSLTDIHSVEVGWQLSILINSEFLLQLLENMMVGVLEVVLPVPGCALAGLGLECSDLVNGSLSGHDIT